MGLDVYVGSLTRYYAREWETVVQRTGREQGMIVKLVFAPGTVHPTWKEMYESAIAWREDMIDALVAHGVERFTWNEGPDAPYFTDKPDWDGYHALLAWAAHDDHPEYPIPEPLPRPLEGYEGYAAARAPGGTQYPHLVNGVELWLPASFGIIFDSITPTTMQARFGSVASLHAELGLLNERTWELTTEQIADTRLHNARRGSTTEELARFAFCVFYELSRDALRFGLPMKLDG